MYLIDRCEIVTAKDERGQNVRGLFGRFVLSGKVKRYHQHKTGECSTAFLPPVLERIHKKQQAQNITDYHLAFIKVLSREPAHPPTAVSKKNDDRIVQIRQYTELSTEGAPGRRNKYP